MKFIALLALFGMLAWANAGLIGAPIGVVRTGGFVAAPLAVAHAPVAYASPIAYHQPIAYHHPAVVRTVSPYGLVYG